MISVLLGLLIGAANVLIGSANAGGALNNQEMLRDLGRSSELVHRLVENNLISTRGPLTPVQQEGLSERARLNGRIGEGSCEAPKLLQVDMKKDEWPKTKEALTSGKYFFRCQQGATPAEDAFCGLNYYEQGDRASVAVGDPVRIAELEKRGFKSPLHLSFPKPLPQLKAPPKKTNVSLSKAQREKLTVSFLVYDYESAVKGEEKPLYKRSMREKKMPEEFLAVFSRFEENLKLGVDQNGQLLFSQVGERSRLLISSSFDPLESFLGHEFEVGIRVKIQACNPCKK